MNKPLLFGAIVLGVAMMGGSFACGDGSDSLLGGGAGAQAAPPASPPVPSTPSAPSMGADDAGLALTEAGILQSKAERMFHALEPQLVATCGGSSGVCHVTGAYQANETPAFLKAPDAYASIKAYPGIVVPDPYGSKLIVKGPHAGPAFTGNDAEAGSRVLAWLTEEAAAIHATPLPMTDPFPLTMGANSVDLSKAGAGVPGAKLTFVAATAGSILTLTHVTLVAPATTGLHIAHPVFDIVPSTGSAVQDPVDSFSNLDQTQAAGTSEPLGVGTLVLTGWDPADKMQIEITTLAAATGAATDGGAAASAGCKSVTSFVANAAPAMQGQGCLNCHNTGGSGNGSLDLSQLGTNDTAACAQALTKVNLANRSQSDILLAPTGQVAAHPFKGAGQGYVQMMLAWINNE